MYICSIMISSYSIKLIITSIIACTIIKHYNGDRFSFLLKNVIGMSIKSSKNNTHYLFNRHIPTSLSKCKFYYL